MLDDICPVPMGYEDDLWRLASISRGKRKRRVGNTIIYESESVEENTSIEHSMQTSTLDDCGQSFYPTSVIHSTNIKRKASMQVSPGEGSKKRKNSSSATVAELQVEDVIMSSIHSHINQAQPPAIHANNTHSSLTGRHPLKSLTDPTPMPQRNRRASRSALVRRHSLNAMLARHGRTQRTELAEQRALFPVVLALEPTTVDVVSGEDAYCLTQEPDQLGRRRALLIAIQYEGQHWRGPKTPETTMHLRGSYADAQDIRSLLIEQGYDPQDIQLMTDEPGTEQHHLPTFFNIKRALRSLVAGARRNDRFFLFFAGHGTQVDDMDGDEDDGKDEGIIPCDWATRFNYQDHGVIIDDELKKICVNPLPKGSQLIGVFDSCHAGTILDLPEQHPERQPDQFFQTNSAERDANGKIGARVMCFAACTDSQEAYSRNIGGQWRGRFTRAFTQGVRNFRSGAGDNRNPTIQELHDSIVEQLENENNALKKIVQNPVLTTSFKKTAFPFPAHLKNPTPFDIFHLPPTASPQDIKSRYYDLVRSHHPDCAACRSLPRSVAHARFQAVTHAYEVLTGKRKSLRGAAATSSEAAELARRRASHRAAYASGRPYTGGRNEWGGFEYPDGGGHRARHNRGDLMGSQTFYVAIAVMTVVLVSLHATHISPLLASRPTSSVSAVDRRHKEAQLALEQARLKGQEYGEERRDEIRRWVKEAGLGGLGQKIGHGSQRKEAEEDL